VPARIPASGRILESLVKLTKSNRFWLLLLLMAAFVATLAATGYLKRAARANSSIASIAKPTYQAWQATQTAVFRAYRSFKDPAAVREYLQSHPVRKLQLGAGGNDPEGWLNTDIEPNNKELYLDATDRYPFPDASFQYVFSEHVIEHLPWESGVAMLKECYRVLAPGGKIRTVTPNLAKYIQLLAGGADRDTQRFIDAKLRRNGWPVTPVPGAYILNRQVREFGHQFLYDPATLRKSLELAGFKQITEFRIGEKTDPVFQEAEFRTGDRGSDLRLINAWEAMAFEAVR
jgi:predicted SAM-dependent methyltransferase